MTFALPAAYAQTPPGDSTEAEIAFWKSVEDSTQSAEFKAYLQAFPDGVFAPLARIRIKQIEQTQAESSPQGQSGESSARSLSNRADQAARAPQRVIENDIGYLGASVGNLTAEQARAVGLGVARGTRLISLVPSGPAERSGLKAGDIVLKLAGAPIADTLGFINVAKTLVPGEPAQVELIRDGSRRTIKVTAGGFVTDNIVAAEDGDAEAMMRLHGLYMSDRLGEPDTEKAMQFLLSAADSNHAQAIDRLARYHWTGEQVEQDFEKAVELLEQAGNLGYVGSLLALGYIYYNEELQDVSGPVQKDYEKSLNYYRRAAEGGSPDAAYTVASMYDEGQGTTENNSEAIRWYRKAADNDDGASIYRLAMMHHNGEGVARSGAEAARYYQRFIELRPDESFQVAFNYAILLANGDGVAKDERKAAEFLYEGLRGGDEHTRTQLLNNAGSWSKTVKRQLQSLLKSGGFYDGSIDGAYGPQTKQAIELASRTDGKAESGSGTASGETASGGSNDLGLGSLEDFSTLD